MNNKTIKRKIISIDEDLCTGCGNCTTGCAEGALQIIDGKAKLVREDFCDGFGDCIGTCPTGALKIIEKEVAAFNEDAVKENLLKQGGKEAVWRMEEAQKKHEQKNHHNHNHHHHGGGCPGLRLKGGNNDSKENSQWPLQLHLVNPAMKVFSERELVVVSTCSPLVTKDFQEKYFLGKSVVIACPKLDRTEPYVNKLKEIIDTHNIPKIIVLRMEVPCCGGLTKMVNAARALSNNNEQIIEEHTISIHGELINVSNI